MSRKQAVVTFFAALMLFSLTACTDSYQKTADSAYDKFTHGDYDSMTPAERAHIDGFLKSLG